MRVAAVFLGFAAFGALIVLAIAGVSAATAVLLTGGAVVVMIGLGNAVGGRHTPNRSPYRAGPTGTGRPDQAGEAAATGDANDAEDADR
jgi:hypothetical protein